MEPTRIVTRRNLVELKASLTGVIVTVSFPARPKAPIAAFNEEMVSSRPFGCLDLDSIVEE